MNFLKNSFSGLVLFSFLFPFVLNIDGVLFDKQDFYSKYSKAEWFKASDKQKKRILEDYIKREAAALDAVSRGFLYNPILLKKLSDKKNQLLISSAYDLLVAYPLIEKEVLSLGKKNLKKDVFLNHIVVSHQNSTLPSPSLNTKEGARLFAETLRDSLELNPKNFSSLAKKYSDDPSSINNGGRVGWVQWGQTPMNFQKIIWSLEPGKISTTIETQYGYHLALVDSVRPSEFSDYDSSSYNNIVFMRSLSTVKNLLQKESSLFDQSVFSSGKIHVFEEEVNRLFSFVEEEQLSFFERGERFDLFSFLDSLEESFVLCRLSGKLYGLRWILDSIKQIPPSKIPPLPDKASFLSFLKPFFLQKFAINYSKINEVDLNLFFIKRLEVEKSKLLYDSLLKRLVNSIENPDSSLVLSYYNEHKKNKYSEPEKVVVRQIKLNSKSLADSLYSLVEKKPLSFVDIASKYSINRKSSGGLMEPFERGKYNFLGEAAFSLGVGDVAGPIENPDKTFSIILLEEKIMSKPIPIKRVYKRIESFLIKESQEKIKEDTFNGYLSNPKLVLGEIYEKYIN